MRNDLVEAMASELNEKLERLDIQNAITVLLLKGYNPRVIDAHLNAAFAQAGKNRAEWVDRQVSNV